MRPGNQFKRKQPQKQGENLNLRNAADGGGDNWYASSAQVSITAENVKNAILDLQADRIGHGVRVLEDVQITERACQWQIPFEVCLTSNYQSGVITDLKTHPLIKIEAEYSRFQS